MLVVDRKSLSPAVASPVRPALEGVVAYKPGMTLAEAGRLAGRTDLAKLASNENLLGCSPKVAGAVLAARPAPRSIPIPIARPCARRSALGWRSIRPASSSPRARRP